jgi:SNF2 family DNA or RNA helicase
MGLGKTLTSISFVHTFLNNHDKIRLPGSTSGSILMHSKPTVLIIVPTTVMQNWKREFAKWLPANEMPKVFVIGKKVKTKVAIKQNEMH